MPIILTCSTPQDGVFFAGELFSCTITLSNIETAGEPQVMTPEPIKPSLAQQPDTFFSSLYNLFPKTVVETPTKQRVIPFWNTTRTMSMSSEIEPMVETIGGSRISPIPEDAIEPLEDEPFNGGSSSFLERSDEGKIIDSAEQMSSKPPLIPMAINVGEAGGVLQVQSTSHAVANSTVSEDTDFATEVNGVSPGTPNCRDSSVGFSYASSPDKPTITTDPRTSTSSLLSKLVIPTYNIDSRKSIAWVFAQMNGQFTIDPHYIKKDAFDSLRERVLYKTAGQPSSTGIVYGGGTLASNPTHHEKSPKPSNIIVNISP